MRHLQRREPAPELSPRVLEGEAVAMQHSDRALYRVEFYREIVNSYGKPFNAPLYTADVESLGSKAEAVARAIGAFERDWNLSSWSALADGYEITCERKDMWAAAAGDAMEVDRGASLPQLGRVGRRASARHRRSMPTEAVDSR